MDIFNLDFNKIVEKLRRILRIGGDRVNLVIFLFYLVYRRDVIIWVYVIEVFENSLRLIFKKVEVFLLY